jgi:hypothetical protein
MLLHEKDNLKDYIMYYFNYMTFWKKPKFGDNQWIGVSGEGVISRQSTEDFQGSEIIL